MSSACGHSEKNMFPGNALSSPTQSSSREKDNDGK